MVPERKITVEDVKYILSNHYQGTPYDPYGKNATLPNCYRTIGINRNNFLSCVQLRPYVPEQIQAIEWISFASNAFNAFIPFYANVNEIPEYYGTCEEKVSTDSLYWTSRLIAAMADADYSQTIPHIERYQEKIPSYGHKIINETDKEFKNTNDLSLLTIANLKIEDFVKEKTYALLHTILDIRSNNMLNRFSRSDG